MLDLLPNLRRARDNETDNVICPYRTCAPRRSRNVLRESMLSPCLQNALHRSVHPAFARRNKLVMPVSEPCTISFDQHKSSDRRRRASTEIESSAVQVSLAISHNELTQSAQNSRPRALPMLFVPSLRNSNCTFRSRPEHLQSLGDSPMTSIAQTAAYDRCPSLSAPCSTESSVELQHLAPTRFLHRSSRSPHPMYHARSE